MKASWKTTVAGILAAVSILCAQAGTLLDDNKDTNPSFSEIFAAFGLLGLGIASRDGDVSSENAGLK